MHPQNRQARSACRHPAQGASGQQYSSTYTGIKALQDFENEVNLQIQGSKKKELPPRKKVHITKPAVLKPIAERQEDLGPFRIPEYSISAESNEKKLDKMCNFITNLGKSMWALRRNMLGELDEEAF